MTLRQHSFGRRSLEMTIGNEMLQCVTSSWFSRYTYSVRLADIVLKFDEWSRVAISWYLLAAGCLVFLGFHFSHGWLGNSFGALVGGIYLSLATYSAFTGWRKSGSYLLVRVEGEHPRTIWVFRERPSREEVDRFLQELEAAVQRARPASPPATLAP